MEKSRGPLCLTAPLTLSRAEVISRQYVRTIRLFPGEFADLRIRWNLDGDAPFFANRYNICPGQFDELPSGFDVLARGLDDGQ